jgi:hypothetical protein
MEMSAGNSTKEPALSSQIHPDIPDEKAWQQGRRIYIRCGYKSILNSQLRDLGARWDGDENALWVGTGKRDQVIPLILAQAERAAATVAIKDAGLWVKIPFDASDVREQAKKLGARWDGDRKEWAMPSAETLATVQALLAAAKDKAAQQKAAANAAAAKTDDDILAESGRTVCGDRKSLTGRLEGHGRRPWAEQSKPQPGDIRITVDGFRVLVLSSTVDFWSDQDQADFSPSREPGWYYTYTCVAVEPTADEAADDTTRAAGQADAEEIAAATEAVRKSVEYVPEAEAGTRRPAAAVAGKISITTGTTRYSDGEITLTQDGTVTWYHPGYYDDYHASEGSTADPDLAARVRAIITAGDRTRDCGRSTYRVTAG